MKRMLRTFRPAPAPLRAWWETIFFALLTAVVIANAAIRGEARLLVPIAATGPLMLAGWWLVMRYRRGRPCLVIDRDGLTYRQGRSERRLEWTNLDRIEMHMIPHNILKLVPADGSKPIGIDWNMVADDGDRFDMRVDDYWRPPRAPRKR